MNAYYFYRNIDAALLEWSKEARRKPLLLRGARQVGKSSAIRHLGQRFRYLAEINFDQDEGVRRLFEQGLSPRELCAQLAVYCNTPVIPGETLLFFDEIQRCLPALASLRYFYEQYPEQHLAAAGSLLEFALEEIPSFGVGRVHSLFMYPFAFDEFLRALGEEMLVEAIRGAGPDKPLPEPIHERLTARLKIFLVLGGMPEAVLEYTRTGDLIRSREALNDLLLGFRDDFAKYKKRIPALLVNEVFESVAHQAEGKFVYERAVPGAGRSRVQDALELLVKAGLVFPVTHSAANGVPLGAEANPKYRRMLPCDTGLFLRLLGFESAAAQVLLAENVQSINRGALAEIFAGLELLKSSPPAVPRQLYCWRRASNPGENRQGNAQVDYVIQREDRIIPMEIKSGSRGSMQSLRFFLEEKRLPLGIRCSLENFSRYENIAVYPLYAISNLLSAFP
ncbi:MAG: ATP-binding protein [Treponema sp.]|jgi:predicted AAA+ superfamily ATPase|nr:ATP-binding protein [Treponema sp.]